VREERGQAMVEFALILAPLLVIVAGIVQFGIGLNYWLDLNRIANQGARFAVVNAWPGCQRTAMGGTCTATPACQNPPLNQSLTNYLECQAFSQGLRSSATPAICYPNDGDATNDGRVGSPVRVTLDSPFTFVPILGIGTITLRGRATMRLEADTISPGSTFGHLTGVGACPP
jgi:Flp pilus assembly protein TadG